MKVFSNLAVSVDGRIADRRKPAQKLGTALDWRGVEALRKKADVVVLGANTLRAALDPVKPKGRGRSPAVAILTGSGDLPAEAPFWNHKNVIRFVFTTKKGMQRCLDQVGDRAFVIEAGEERVDVRRVLARLGESGMKSVLVEGGGVVVADFIEAGCLNEMFVTLTPWLLGGAENPGLVGGPGLHSWAGLTLIKARKVKNEIYLHYRVKDARRV